MSAAPQDSSSVMTVSVLEAARMLSVSKTTVHRLVSNGDLAKVVVGAGSRRKHYRIPVSSIDRFVRGDEAPAPYKPAYI